MKKKSIQTPKKYLFVCHKNINRSVYAASWLTIYLQANNLPGEVRSAGISTNPNEGRQLTQELVDWADRMIIMEDYMKERMQQVYINFDEKSFVLDIPDAFITHFVSPKETKHLTPTQAIEYLKDKYNHFDIDCRFFSKILIGKLELILG